MSDDTNLSEREEQLSDELHDAVHSAVEDGVTVSSAVDALIALQFHMEMKKELIALQNDLDAEHDSEEIREIIVENAQYRG